jgi:hypothetical protein
MSNNPVVRKIKRMEALQLSRWRIFNGYWVSMMGE